MTETEPVLIDREPKPPSPAARVIRVIVRLLLAAILGVAVGIGAYFGVPALYRQYIEPVRINSERIQDLEQAVEQLSTDQSQRAEGASSRMAEIERQLASQAEALATLQADVQRLQTDVTRQDRQISSLADLADRVDELGNSLEETQAQVAALQGNDAPTRQLARQLQWLRAAELLTRARLWLMQNNIGLAGDNVRQARAILEAVVDSAPAEQATVAPILARLDLALTDLRTAPVVAADDIEIAWQLLLATAPSSQEE